MALFNDSERDMIPGGHSSPRARENLINKIVKETKILIKDVEKKLTEARALANDIEKHLNSIQKVDKEAEIHKWAELEEAIENGKGVAPGIKEGQKRQLESIRNRYDQLQKSIEQIEGRMRAEDTAEERYVLKETQEIMQEHKELQEFLELLEQYRLHPGEMRVDGLIAKIDGIIRLHRRIELYDKYILN